MENVYELKSGKTLKIMQDELNDNNPQEWDNLSKKIFFGKYSHLGDKHDFNSDDYIGWGEVENALHKEYDIACIQKIYGYSHSGLTISTEPFSCQWDSGVLGFAIITKQDLRANYNIKNVTNVFRLQGHIHIENEIEVLNQYVTGDVYGFQLLDSDGEDIDSCWGFYGSDIETNGILDHLDEETVKEIKELI